MSRPRSRALALRTSTATGEPSTAVTCQPSSARYSAFLPDPQARSSARPRAGPTNFTTSGMGASNSCSPARYRSFHCSRLNLFCPLGRQLENFLQDRNTAIDFFLGDDVRRQESQHRIVGTVQQQPVLHRIQHNLLARNTQLHADHKTLATYLFDEREVFLQIFELPAEVAAHLANVRQQSIQNV